MPHDPIFPDHLIASMEPYRRWREEADMLANMYKPALEPLAALEKQLAAMTNSSAVDLVQQQYKMLDSLYGSSRSVADQIMEATQLDRSITDQLHALIQPSAVEQTLGLMDRFGIDQRKISEVFAHTALGLRSDIEAIFGAVKQPTIEREIEQMLAQIRGVDFVSLDAAAQTVSIGGAAFAITDFNNLIEEAASDAEHVSAAARLRVFLQLVLARAAQFALMPRPPSPLDT